jgi:hypothetical protein
VTNVSAGPTFSEVVDAVEGAMELISCSTDRIERLMVTKGPASLVHKEVYVIQQTVAALKILTGIMESVHEGYEDDEDD